MESDNKNVELEAFLNNESLNHINNNNNNHLIKSPFDSIDLSFIDDDQDLNNEIIQLTNCSKDNGNDGDSDLDEPDAMALQNRMLTPIPPDVDINLYQHKKTLAQGMMDLALLLANANQLRYVLESKSIHPYYLANIILLAISISLQVGVGIALIINSQYCVKNEKEMLLANRINNFTLIGVFIITIVNVFISAFGIADSSS